MTLWFGTKRTQNGHRNYLGFSTILKKYSKQPRGWMTRTDFAEITAKDMKAIEKELEDAGFTRADLEV